MGTKIGKMNDAFGRNARNQTRLLAPAAYLFFVKTVPRQWSDGTYSSSNGAPVTLTGCVVRSIFVSRRGNVSLVVFRKFVDIRRRHYPGTGH